MQCRRSPSGRRAILPLAELRSAHCFVVQAPVPRAEFCSPPTLRAVLQIILFVGVMEAWRENKVVLAAEGQTHYMKGGKPGYFPTFDMVPHPVPFNLYDPWKVMTEKTEEQKAKGRLVELNNGRLAMIGLFGFVSEAQVPGSVPLLKGVIPSYAGDVMQPFTENIFTTYGTPLV